MNLVRWTSAAAVVALLVAGSRAQSQGAQVPASQVKLNEQIADIDKLRMIVPLKLTTEQLDKLVTTVKASQAAYMKRIAAISEPYFESLAEDVKKIRASMLKGADLPKEFDAKVTKMQAEYVKKRDTEDQRTLKSLSENVKGILTQEQIDKAINLVKVQLSPDGKPTKEGTAEQWTNLYVLGTFILYPRAIPLLEDMKAASGGSASAGSKPRVASATGARE